MRASDKKNKYIRVIYAHENKMEHMSTVLWWWWLLLWWQYKTQIYKVWFLGIRIRMLDQTQNYSIFLGESETTTPNAVCLHNAPIYHQLQSGGLNVVTCVIIPSTESAVVIIPHIILNKLDRWQNPSISISLLILLLPRYLTGSINKQLTNKNNPNVHLFSPHL